MGTVIIKKSWENDWLMGIPTTIPLRITIISSEIELLDTIINRYVQIKQKAYSSGNFNVKRNKNTVEIIYSSQWEIEELDNEYDIIEDIIAQICDKNDLKTP